MLRVRKQDGSVEVIEGGVFLELYDETTDKVGAVFFSPQSGQVVQISPQTLEAERYTRMFPRVTFSGPMTKASHVSSQ